jgi:predicted site-specific integrase-resolvase
VASGISFEKRKDFFKLLDEVIQGKVERVVISYKDRMSRVGFDLFHHLFNKYNTEIIVMSEVGNEKLDSEEIFEEIISLLHCYSMKLYSKRRKQKLEIVAKDLEIESELNTEEATFTEIPNADNFTYEIKRPINSLTLKDHFAFRNDDELYSFLYESVCNI